jgi:hypothetical protein
MIAIVISQAIRQDLVRLCGMAFVATPDGTPIAIRP